MTTVINLHTGTEKVFSLPPAHAVQAAREQARHNFNTWDYPDPITNPDVVFGRYTVQCGDWCAILPKED